jgi:hypothetical protein
MKEVLKLDFHQNLHWNTTFTYTFKQSTLFRKFLYITPSSEQVVAREILAVEKLCEKSELCWLNDDSPNYSLKFLYINIFLCIGRGWWNVFCGKTLIENWVVWSEWWQGRVLRTWRRRVLTVERWRRRMQRIDIYRVHLKWTTEELAWGGLIGYGRLW